MAIIEVQGITDEVVQKLEQRAAANSRTIESEARHILEEAAAPDVDMAQKQAEFRALARKLREKTKGRRPAPPAEVIVRFDRDHGHRDGSCDWS